VDSVVYGCTDGSEVRQYGSLLSGQCRPVAGVCGAGVRLCHFIA